jgi:Xaa-Pro aminopeptidase
MNRRAPQFPTPSSDRAPEPISPWMPQWDVDHVALLDADHPLVSPVSDATVDRARRYRLDRLKTLMRSHDCPAILLYDPVNIMYALDVSNMNVWMSHNASHYALVFADGPAIDFAYKGADHLAAHSPLVDEARVATNFIYLYGGDVEPRASQWAAEIVDLLREHGDGRVRLAVDKCEPPALLALQRLGVEVIEGQQITEHARSIKSPDEIELMLWSVRVCEAAIERMRRTSEPGRTEIEIWAALHHENIRYGGEYIETRLLSSGPRTNPWYQQAGHRQVELGDMLAVDCDMIGPYGYCADLSRSWTVGNTRPTGAQLDLYRHAVEHVEHNVSLLRPGLSYRDFNEASWRIPERFVPRNYGLAFHGVGMADEWPSVPTHPCWGAGSFSPPDGMLEAGMVVCVESLVALDGAGESVKLETQVLITDDGHHRLDRFEWEPWD